jgi:hypothetical protein
MRRYFTLLAFALLAATPAAMIHIAVNAKPVRPDGSIVRGFFSRTKPREIPKLCVGATNWGKLDQAGRSFKLSGHPIWEAEGTIREDGRCTIIWTLLADGQVCPGVYEVLPSGELEGLWGYEHDVRIEPNGDLTGNVRGDRIYLLPIVDRDL